MNRSKRYRRRRHWFWIWLSLGFIGLIGVGVAVWKLPPLLYGDVVNASDDARLKAMGDMRTALVAGLAGLAALASLALTARTYRLTQEGQITERYTRAIDQLGSDKLDIRLGGIYALERIAVDSGRDHSTVVEVLSAFAREHSEAANQHRSRLEGLRAVELLRRLVPRRHITRPDQGARALNAYAPDSFRRITTDVQATLTVLGRLPERLNVSRGDLGGAALVGANLAGARLEEANFRYSDLRGATLTGADLARASLTAATLEGA